MKKLYWIITLGLLINLQSLPAIVQAQSSGEPPASLVPLPESPSHKVWSHLVGKKFPQYRPGMQPSVNPTQTESVEDSPTGSADFAMTAFTTYSNGSWHVIVGNAEARKTVPITGFSANDAWPRLSRDGRYVVYIESSPEGYRIYKSPTDRSYLQRISQGGASYDSPSWEADNESILYSSNRSGSWNIYRMAADGSKVQRLTDFTGKGEQEAEWSPTGNWNRTKIAWIRDPSGDDPYRDLWVMNADGTNQHAILTHVDGLEYLYFGVDDDTLYFSYDSDEDGFWELGMFKEGDAAPTLMHNVEGTDLLAGRQTPGLCFISLTAIYYIDYNGTTYIQRMDMGMASIPGKPKCFGAGIGQYGNFNWFGDFVNLDFQPPVTTVQSLPKYSLSTGINIIPDMSDPGLAGIFTYQLQYKLDNGEWTDLYNGQFHNVPIDYSRPFNKGTPGTVVDFRMNALDRAMNQEPMPADPQTETRLYSYTLTGKLTDNRGNPALNSGLVTEPAAWEPAQTDANGRYLTYLTGSGTHKLSAAGQGFGSFASTWQDITGNSSFSTYLSPAVNLISNGDFENGTDGWNVAEGSSITINSQSSRSGTNSVQLGTSCIFPCLEESQIVGTDINLDHDGLPFSIKIDPMGNWHLLYMHNRFDANIVYRQRSPDREWLPETQIQTEKPVSLLDMAMDKDGKLYLAWYCGGNSSIYFSEKPVNGSWAAPIKLQSGIPVKSLKIREQGGHIWIVYREGFTDPYFLSAWERPANADFCLHSQFLQFNGTSTAFDVNLDGDQNAHFILPAGAGGAIMHYTWFADGRPMAGESINANYAIILRSFMDEDGNIQVSWENYSGGSISTWYSFYDAEYKIWHPAEQVPASYFKLSGAEADSSGGLHLFSSNGQYIYRSPQGIWSSPVDYFWPHTTAIDEIGHLLIFTFSNNNLNARQRSSAAADITTEISQTVFIPEEMHSPTLAFDYAMEDSGKVSPALLIKIEDESGSTTVDLPPSNNINWKHFWYDLSPWAGKQVTVRMIQSQKQGGLNANVLLDNISLGSWEMLVIKKVTPDYPFFPGLKPETITIQGENLNSPIVEIDGKPFTPQFLDKYTMQIQLAPGDLLFQPEHEIRVTNEGGYIWMTKIRMQPILFLPLIK
jgi:hypothetical protein